MEQIKASNELKDICLRNIKSFLLLVGINFDKRRGCTCLAKTPENEDKIRRLNEYDYQMAITQIFRHLREVENKTCQSMLINYLANEINNECGPLNNSMMKSVFHDSWLTLYN